jgi:hypothetical protein
MCYGLVTVDAQPREHWWLRRGDVVVDPTIDQFGHTEAVLVKLENDPAEPVYKETFYFCVQPAKVIALAGLR